MFEPKFTYTNKIVNYIAEIAMQKYSHYMTPN